MQTTNVEYDANKPLIRIGCQDEEGSHQFWKGPEQTKSPKPKESLISKITLAPSSVLKTVSLNLNVHSFALQRAVDINLNIPVNTSMGGSS